MLELMAVIAIMGILAALAIPGFGYLAASTKVKGASTELYLALVRARSESVKRNRDVAVIADPGGWQDGWQVVADGNNDGDFDDIGGGDVVVYSQGELRRVAINLDCDGTPAETAAGAGEDNTRVKFRPSGRIVAYPGFCDGRPSFEVTSVDPDRQAALLRCVQADLSGRPYVTTTGVTPANC